MTRRPPVRPASAAALESADAPLARGRRVHQALGAGPRRADVPSSSERGSPGLPADVRPTNLQQEQTQQPSPSALVVMWETLRAPRASGLSTGASPRSSPQRAHKSECVAPVLSSIPQLKKQPSSALVGMWGTLRAPRATGLSTGASPTSSPQRAHTSDCVAPVLSSIPQLEKQPSSALVGMWGTLRAPRASGVLQVGVGNSTSPPGEWSYPSPSWGTREPPGRAGCPQGRHRRHLHSALTRPTASRPSRARPFQYPPTKRTAVVGARGDVGNPASPPGERVVHRGVTDVISTARSHVRVRRARPFQRPQRKKQPSLALVGMWGTLRAPRASGVLQVGVGNSASPPGERSYPSPSWGTCEPPGRAGCPQGRHRRHLHSALSPAPG